MIDVTNSQKDVHDFWYNSEDIMPKQTNNNYAECVDHLVTTMKPQSDAPFDTEAYKNYRDSVTTKKRKSFDELYNEYSAMSLPEQITNLKQLSRKLVSQIDEIIDKLDVILEDKK